MDTMGALLAGTQTPVGRMMAQTAKTQYGGNEATKCLTFSIDGSGVQSSSPEDDCWSRVR